MSEITQLLDENGTFGQDPTLRQSPLFVQGKVTDNGDKENAGMVKVEFLSWKSGSNICQWMPVLRSCAGTDYGSYVMPEVGDVVLVGFLGADMRRPFVLGTLYPAGAKYPGQCFTDKNTVKSFRTKGGHQVVLSEEKDKAVCTVTTPGGLSVCLDDEKQCITLSDKNQKNLLRLDCKNGGAELNADSKIVLKTGKCTLTLDGKGGEMKLECDRLTAKASQQVQISANQMLQLSGGMLKAEGKQTVQVKGSAMTEISGGMVKIN
ncbi:phage baseplate assembly protein V [uncultured Ruthenibacterium sp.]|mgnify:CR=1 FL=1|uniref:phage baseplate assembly protein V n=1 Tax=uncultured Ruthenibacterium sp. TaxID=1905347 RepID=UPI00349E5926